MPSGSCCSRPRRSCSSSPPPPSLSAIPSCCTVRPKSWRSTSAAAGPAVEAGLLEVGARVEFAHPLVRSAAYRSASTDDRHRVHRALAEATDPEKDPDRRVWHRARAASGPDEDVAAELERSAGRAQARGGVAAAAAFLERAGALSPDPGKRARRALEAAEAKQLAGAPQAASTLLATAVDGPLDERETRTGAAPEGTDRPRPEARRWRPRRSLLEAAGRLESIEPDARASRRTWRRCEPGRSLVASVERSLRPRSRGRAQRAAAGSLATCRRPAARRAGSSVHRRLRGQRGLLKRALGAYSR